MKPVLVAINSKYIHSNLAIFSLRANAGVYRHKICLKEYTINQNLDDILADLVASHPTFLAFSCYLWNVTQLEALSLELSKLLPDVPIWFGGPEVSYRSVAFLAKHPEVTGVMCGEGEATFRELISFIADANENTTNVSSLRDIAGISYRDEAGIHTTPARDPLSLDSLLFPYEACEDVDLKHRIYYYETSRGCPFRCSYCLSSVVKCLRFRSLSLVFPELQYFLDRRIPQVKFVDRTFNCNKEHALGILNYLREHDNGVTNWHMEIAAELLDEDYFAVLSSLRPGLVQLEIGVQTTNQETLHAIERHSDFSHLKSVCDRLHAFANMHLHLDLIAGLPGEDYESFARSFDDVYQLAPEDLQLGFLKVLSGAPIAGEADTYGIVYRSYPPYEVLKTASISYEELQLLKQVEQVLELYHNSCQFRYTLSYLVPLCARPFEFFSLLGAFYHKKTAGGIAISRNARYDTLLSFAKETFPETCDFALLTELMTFDLYLREDAKTRPGWCPDQLPIRDLLAVFRKKVKKTEHLEVFRYNFLQMPETSQYQEQTTCVAFDYSVRNPLTYDASLHVLPVDN